MSYLLENLTKKEDVDKLILDTLDKVLVLRIGRASDVVCMQLDEIVSAHPVPSFPHGIAVSFCIK